MKALHRPVLAHIAPMALVFGLLLVTPLAQLRAQTPAEPAQPTPRAAPETPTPQPAPETPAPQPVPEQPAPTEQPPAATEPAPTPAQAPREPEPRREQREQPAKNPAPVAAAPLTPTPDSAMADTLPSFDRDLLPEYDSVRQPPSFFPHMQDDGAQLEPPTDNSAANDSAGNSGSEGSDADDGPGWFSRLYDSVFEDRTVRNGIIVLTLIVVFMIFRLRNGRKGYA